MRIVNVTQPYSVGKMPLSLFNTFVVLLIVNASCKSLVVWSLRLETTTTLDQSTWCSASGDAVNQNSLFS